MTQAFTFESSFEALTGNPPFQWQTRLFEEWLSAGKLPSAVDVPTGLGKTAVMAVWLVARAAGARVPRRLVYVVDRRAVVDQATRFAEHLRRNMPSGLESRLGIEDGTGGLPISTLRGGFVDNRDWLEDPVKPSIIVGTIDMIGSRMLFEGYGVSRAMRPYQAGFLCVDTLVLLDEAHLCPPFEALLRQISDRRDLEPVPDSGDGTITPLFHVIPLSATGRQGAEMPPNLVFDLDDRDRDEPVIHQRLTARKRLQVTELADARLLVTEMANRAIELADGDTSCRVIAYFDRRVQALNAKQLIDRELKRRERAGEVAASWDTELLVGERRVHERTELENWLERNGFLGDTKSSLDGPRFLVATSAGEVGVDLDADHMVCDLVAYERMVQRLGRVNRRGGEYRTATVDVFAVRPDLKANPRKADKEAHERNLKIYNRRLAALRHLPRGKDGRRDASPSAATMLKRSFPGIVNAATTDAPLYPELNRPLIDAWSMTSLTRHEGRPEVAPWLRGWEDEDDPQTDVIWREHLPCEHRGDTISAPPALVADFFRSAPVHASERLEAPSGRVFDWLLKRAAQIATHGKDRKPVAGHGEIIAIVVDRANEHRRSATLSDLRRLVAHPGSMSKSERRYRDRDKREWKERLLPGATLVVDARLGGLRNGMLDEKLESKPTTADADEDWRQRAEDPALEPARPLIRFRVQELVGSKDGEGIATPAPLDEWRHVRTFETRIDAGGVARCGLAIYKWPEEAVDEDFRSILSAPQILNDHAEETEARARDLAVRLELPREEIEALATAARLHDVGKAASRWQNAMNAPKEGRPYAKTRGGGNWRLLDGYRHEFGSLLKAESEELPDRTRDLILHLIAAHHGYARPLISAAGCEDGPPSLLEAKAGEVALRFARMQRRYGPWGLAWREAILRAADQSVSRDWSRRHGKLTHG